MNFSGTIIAESLVGVLPSGVVVLGSTIKPVTSAEKTHWLKQWTLQNVEIAEDQGNLVSDQLSRLIDPQHRGSWYIDFKNDKYHYFVFFEKVIVCETGNKSQYNDVIQYGISVGIPKHQLDFLQS